MIEIQKAESNTQIEELCNLANEIWHEHYTPIIGKEQVVYMLSKFQSLKSVEKQITEGYEYYSVYLDNEIIAYFSIQPQNNTVFLSKFYLLKKHRYKGYGKIMLKFIEDRSKELSLSKITLTVNKYNSNSVKAYEKMGFTIIKSFVQDIGEGFVMDDFVMEKVVD